MEVYRIRAAGVTDAEIWAHAARDPLMIPSMMGARDLMAFDALALQAAAEFDALDLSPVLPVFSNINARRYEPE